MEQKCITTIFIKVLYVLLTDRLEMSDSYSQNK